ncbi:mechanosensitive ion channel family protein [Mongoliibacter ruber]|uniref:Mechanosensitive ion channel-like protein n=1 Tax=Mongoliibacter ruber TaxID=1750599 RepID=A0A2T0WT66_9BACT|nr:mechanosensitive ion channel domain-containing protein [Mongoliibacter ruber]PRY89870.1 mechanosensitive ion channel-like protein [Mongoliibacter ruber]
MEDLDFRSTLERIKNIVLGDIESIEKLAISIFFGVLIFLIFFFVSRWLKNLANSRVKKNTDDPLLADFIGSILRIIIMLFGFTIIFRLLGLSGVVGGILAGAGITAFVIGFALKDIGENFLAGILLAFKRPFRVGDIVEINNLRGRVLVLNLRDTQLKTSDGKDLFIPNANIIKSPLINYTIDGFLAYTFDIQVSSEKDLDKSLELILQTIEKVPGVLKDKRKATAFISDVVGTNVKISVTYWVNTYNRRQPDRQVKSKAIGAVMRELKKNEII